MTEQEVTLELASRTLAAQPFSRLLGARVASFGGGSAVLDVPFRDDLLQQNGFLHGGVLAFAADNAITFAAGSVLGPAVLTGGVSIQYVRPAVGTVLSARAHTMQSGRRQAVCRCDLYAVDEAGGETLCAVAQGTVLKVEPREG